MKKSLALIYEILGYILAGTMTSKCLKQLEDVAIQLRKKTIEAALVVKNKTITFAFTVTPKQFSNFQEIAEIGNFETESPDMIGNEKYEAILLAPVSDTKDEKLVLYWEGEGQKVPNGEGMNAYLNEKGYEVIQKAHPSLIINAMAQLTEEKLTELGIPKDGEIILPTLDKDSLILSSNGNLCFFVIGRYEGVRDLSLINTDTEEYKSYGDPLIVRKKKK